MTGHFGSGAEVYCCHIRTSVNVPDDLLICCECVAVHQRRGVILLRPVSGDVPSTWKLAEVQHEVTLVVFCATI